MNHDDGGPAFPQQSFVRSSGDIEWGQDGMTLRDWFAAQEQIDPSETYGFELLEALAGPRPDGDWKSHPLKWFEWANCWQAKIKFARADAMIAARKGEKP